MGKNYNFVNEKGRNLQKCKLFLKNKISLRGEAGTGSALILVFQTREAIDVLQTLPELYN